MPRGIPHFMRMKYIRLTSTDPYENLATEEFLFSQSEEDFLILWQNENTVVIGKNQNAYAEVDLAYAKEAGIRIARRITGGGAVFHDAGNINFSLITKDTHALDYAYFASPITEVLGSLGLRAEVDGRNDILANGKKISGNAQTTKNGRTLHHGTLLYDTDTERMARVLRIDREKLAYHAVRSHKSRVGNIRALLGTSLSPSEFTDLLETRLIAALGAERTSLPDDPQIAALAARNRSPAWILADRRYLTDYTVTRRQKFPAGVIEISLLLSRDRIEKATISGDFFERAPAVELEAALSGLTAAEAAAVDPAPYIDRLTADEWRELLKE